VQENLNSARERLKLYNKVPTNGMVMFVGTVLNEKGGEKKLILDFEPYKPINVNI